MKTIKIMLTQLLPDKQLEVPLEQEKKKCE